MKKVLTPLVLALGVLNASSVLACDPPEKPVIPDGDNSTEAQMLAAKAEVDNYLEAGQSYLSCAKSDRAHNRMVKNMENVGLKFNLALRRFKKSQQV